MKITFYREGFANNSSSSHSIIFSGNTHIEDEYDDGDFGWGFFTCKTKEAKECYLISTLKSNFPYKERIYFDRWVKLFLADVFEDIDETLAVTADGYGVDHQSVIVLPKDYSNPSFPSVDFFTDLYNELIFNEYVFLGGNDNDDSSHEYSNYHENVKKRDDIISLLGRLTDIDRDVYCVKDSKTKEWVLSRRNGGTLVKVCFDKDIKESFGADDIEKILNETDDSPIYDRKSEFPYLVDLKITDSCPFNCMWCYQSSTPMGLHADANHIIDNILPELRRSNVFEIVLGGGEPTTHPHLYEIVSAFADARFKTGITTKNYNFGKTKQDKKILAELNSIAISCNSIKELKKVEYWLNNIVTDVRYDMPDVYIQTILGMMDLAELEEFFEYAAKLDIEFITFLGYKDFGFGTEFNPKIVDAKWIELVKRYSSFKFISFGIDSVIARTYRSLLEHHGVRNEYLVGTEGKQTCYVNAVENYVAPSSFTDNNKVEYNFNSSNFLNIFEKF